MVENNFLTGGHSDASDLAKSHKKFLKHNIIILKHTIVFVVLVFYFVRLQCMGVKLGR